MAGQTKFNATLLAEIQNNIGNTTTLTDVGKTLAAVIKQATAEALLKYTDVIKPNADTKEKVAFEKQSKLIEPLISLMIIDKVVASFQEELKKANTYSQAAKQSYETLVSLRDETFKSIKQIGTDIKISGKGINDFLSNMALPDLYSYGKTALGYVIGKAASDAVSLFLNQSLNVGLLVKGLLSIDTSSEKKMRNSTAGLVTVVTGMIDDLKPGGGYITGIPKFIAKYISPKTFWGALSRATFLNLVSYIDFQIFYGGTHWVLDELGVYKSEWYIDATDKILPAL